MIDEWSICFPLALKQALAKLSNLVQYIPLSIVELLSTNDYSMLYDGAQTKQDKLRIVRYSAMWNDWNPDDRPTMTFKNIDFRDTEILSTLTMTT